MHHSTSPGALLTSIRTHAHLIRQLVMRDVRQRYSGSALGVLWMLAQPLLLLAVYSFVFTQVFQARWGNLPNADDAAPFALILFAGLIMHQFLADVLGRAPRLMVDHASYVKKIIFPLEILPIIATGSALFHAMVYIVVLVIGLFICGITPHATWIYAPFVLLPFAAFTLGLCYILASLGTYLRDIQQLMGLLLTVLMFMSPIFYPLEALPEHWREFLFLNPLTWVVTAWRSLLFYQNIPSLYFWGGYLFACFTTCGFGFWWFQKTRKGFAEVM